MKRGQRAHLKVEAGEVAKNALVAQAQSAIHLVEEVLLTTGEAAGKDSPVESQRHVDTVQRHPVDFSLPALPIPVRVAVAERAHVHVVTVLGANLESQPSRKHTSCFHVEDTRGRGEGISMWSPVPFSPQLSELLQ